MSNEFRSKIFVIISAAFLCLLIGSVIYSSDNGSVDPSNCCKIDTDKRKITIIIIDQSNEFERIDKENARNYVNKILDSLDTDEKLLVIEIDPDNPYEPKVLFERCAPKRLGRFSILFDDVGKLKEGCAAFRNDFWKHSNVSFERKKLPRSPILETLGYTACRFDFKQAIERRVYLFSDLIQYYGSLNFYSTIPRVNDVTDEGLSLNSLHFLSAQMYLIPAARRNKEQWKNRSRLKSFWEEWLVSHHAIVKWDTVVSLKN